MNTKRAPLYLAKLYWLILSTEALEHNWGFLSDMPLAVLDALELKKIRNQCRPLFSSFLLLQSFTCHCSGSKYNAISPTMPYHWILCILRDVLISTKTYFLSYYNQNYSSLTQDHFLNFGENFEKFLFFICHHQMQILKMY